MISVKHLTKCYGEYLAVDDISFEITEGHVYGFLGPNGAGKSTFLKIITEEIEPSTGEIIKDKVLFIPGGKGSTVGSYVIFQMMKNNTAPKAIICINAEPIIATGAIMSDIPMVDSPAETKELTTGTLVEVDGDNGTITLL